MIIKYSNPHREGDYETEVPCEADPLPFARQLIQEAAQKEDVAVDENWELRWCSADGSPLVTA